MNAKNKQSHSSDDRTTGGPIYVDAGGRAHLLVDLTPADYRVVDENEGRYAASAALKSGTDVPFRRFDMPRVFEELSGSKILFAQSEHRRYEGKTPEAPLASEIPYKMAEFEAILADIRDVDGMHLIFSRIIPDLRKIVKAASDPMDGIRNALCYRDAKTEATLVSALYRFWYAPLGRRVRDFAFSMNVAPYDARELAAAKIEGYCRYFRSEHGDRPVAFENVRDMCDRIACGKYADDRNAIGDSLFSVLVCQLSNRLNYEWAARALDVLLNELTDVFDPKVDPIDPFQRDRTGRTIEDRIAYEGGEARFQNFATAMLVQFKAFFSETARNGRVTSFSTPLPEEISNLRDRVAKGYSDAFKGTFSAHG